MGTRDYHYERDEYTDLSRTDDSGGTNRQYKDRLFKAIFGSSERKNLTLELYNALNGSSYTNADEIELSTINNVVYMGMRNDVSFLFEQVMNLWEQQSTPNPNMPLRFLLYYAHVMERYVKTLPPEEGDIYASALVRLPTPRMVLFYNGPGRMPDYLYLSNAYENSGDPDVETRIRVINISSGQSELLEQCRPLRDYTTFVENFQRHRADRAISDQAAASRAIADLRDGEVKTYLMGHEAEVIDMLLTEYDEAKTLKAERYVGKREGLEQGLRTLCELVADGDLSMEKAVKKAVAYGITNEADLRRKAVELSIHLP